MEFIVDRDDLVSELVEQSRKKRQIQDEIKRMGLDLKQCNGQIMRLGEEMRNSKVEISLARERLASQNRELNSLREQLTFLKDQNQKMCSEKRRLNETGGVDYTLFETLKSEHSATMACLGAEKSKVEWHLGEETQWWNDCKWRVGELEADLNNRQWQMDDANRKVIQLSAEIEGLRVFRDQAASLLEGFVLIRKQPEGGRGDSRLLTWDENSPGNLRDFRCIWFEILAAQAKQVFFSANFFNWECLLLCENFDKEAGKHGVLVDIPPGRYEFRFLVDGHWKTCTQFPTVLNEHGALNNWISVE